MTHHDAPDLDETATRALRLAASDIGHMPVHTRAVEACQYLLLLNYVELRAPGRFHCTGAGHQELGRLRAKGLVPA